MMFVMGEGKTPQCHYIPPSHLSLLKDVFWYVILDIKKKKKRSLVILSLLQCHQMLTSYNSGGKLHARNGFLLTEARRETQRRAGSNRDPRKGSQKSKNNDVMNGFAHFHQQELTEENKDLPCSAPGTWGHRQVTPAQLTFH